MRVVGNPPPSAPRPAPHRDSANLAAPWSSIVLPQSDFVVICCQWEPETTPSLRQGTVCSEKAGGVLITVARGEIVDEEALAVRAHQHDHLRGAALYV